MCPNVPRVIYYYELCLQPIICSSDPTGRKEKAVPRACSADEGSSGQEKTDLVQDYSQSELMFSTSALHYFQWDGSGFILSAGIGWHGSQA